MLLTRQSGISRQKLSAALHQLSGERRQPDRLILPASLPVDQFLVPESVTAFLANVRDCAERASAVSIGIY